MRNDVRSAGVAALACFSLLSLSLTGCGGGSAGRQVHDAANTGRAVITLQWPETSNASKVATRVIPAGAQSVKVTFLSGTTAVQSAVIARPTSSATFKDLPAGTFAVQAVAYPNADATGNAQATASSSAAIIAGQKTPVNLTLATTIQSVKITPDNIQFTGNPVTLTATAFDGPNATGNIVLSGAWKWDNSNPAVITLTPNGGTALIAPIVTGLSNVTATDTESGKSFTKPINVAPLN